MFSSKSRNDARQTILRELAQNPPRIGVIGVSGVGKSSTINRMFRTSLAVSHTVACTKKFHEVDTELQMVSGEIAGEKAVLKVVDAPGLGEDIQADPTYLEMYERYLPECDVILWVMSSINRAIALDQNYLQRLSRFQKKIVFGLNQIDLVYPRDWSVEYNIPSRAMEQAISEIVEDRQRRIASIVGGVIQVIPYSADKGLNLESLFASLIKNMPGDRSWMFHGLKNFSYKDFMPTRLSVRS